MKLVDQWRTIEDGLPAGWEDVRLTLTTEQPGDLPRAAQVLGPINAGKVGSSARLPRPPRRGPARGPDGDAPLRAPRRRANLVPSRAVAARRASLGASASSVAEPARRCGVGRDELGRGARPPPVRLDRSPLRARDRLEHAARPNGAPLRSAQPGPRRLAPRLHVPLLGPLRLRRLAVDGPALLRASRHESITGRTRVLRVLSDTDNVDTQGPVWLVGGKTL